MLIADPGIANGLDDLPNQLISSELFQAFIIHYLAPSPHLILSHLIHDK
jgi:hypothetical protein